MPDKGKLRCPSYWSILYF